MRERKRIWIPEAPLINLRRYEEVSVLRHGANVEGRFEVELVHARTGLVKRRLEFSNVITNAGLDSRVANTSSGLTMLHATNQLVVGTGSSEPSVTDTALDAQIASTSSNGGFGDTWTIGPGGEGRYYNTRNRTRVFTESQANGNLTELGMANNDGLLFCRQLFRDENGNPTTITKTSEDQLRVRYHWRVYYPLEDEVSEIMVDGEPVQVTHRLANADQNAAWGVQTLDHFGLVLATNNVPYSIALLEGQDTLFPRSGSTTVNTNSITRPSSGNITLADYTPGTFFRERESRYDPSLANFPGGIRFIFSNMTPDISSPQFSSRFQFQMLLGTPIIKSNTDRLIIQERFTFGRYDPEE